MEEPTGQFEVESDGGGLVDDDDAEPIRVLEHLLGVGVVRGAEGVGAHPVQEIEIVDHGGVVVALAVHVQVLVHAEATEVEGLVVDEEASAVDAHRPDADGQSVTVDDAIAVDEVDLEVVEVTVARTPQLGVRYS